MTQQEWERMTAAFVRKAKNFPRDHTVTDDEWLADTIGMVVLDTSMVLDGSVPLDRWES